MKLLNKNNELHMQTNDGQELTILDNLGKTQVTSIPSEFIDENGSYVPKQLFTTKNAITGVIIPDAATETIIGISDYATTDLIELLPV